MYVPCMALHDLSVYYCSSLVEGGREDMVSFFTIQYLFFERTGDGSQLLGMLSVSSPLFFLIYRVFTKYQRFLHKSLIHLLCAH